MPGSQFYALHVPDVIPIGRYPATTIAATVALAGGLGFVLEILVAGKVQEKAGTCCPG